MTIYKTEYMGRTLQYVITPCGNYLYKQRKKTAHGWKLRIIRLLCNAGYDEKEIDEITKCYFTNNWYISEHFYKKPEAIVQRVNELGKDWIIDLELSK